MSETNAVLAVKGIHKAFPGVRALSGVDLTVKEGEVLALIGENGAGKTTLMNILMGVLKADQGSIHFQGEQVNIDHPQKASALGLSMICQEISLVPEMSIAENIFLGRIPRHSRFSWVDWKELYSSAKKVLRKVGLQADPKTKVKHLSLGQQQMVEIAKAISAESQLIIMDEPTSALSNPETAHLFEIIRFLKSRHISIIYISHRLEEIFAIADRVTVLRDGRLIDTLVLEETTKERLISLMVGRSIEEMFAEKKKVTGETILKVENLCRGGALRDISFELKGSEIVGLYGLVGAGRTELALSLFGVDPIDSGAIFISGQEVRINSPRDALRCGIGYLSEDRKGQSLFPSMNVKGNITISNLKRYSRLQFINRALEDDAAEQYIRKLKIKLYSLRQKISNLSGGNQQKAVVARLLALNPKIMIMDEPTRGIDVGSKAEIHYIIEEMAESGIAVILISSELPEVLRIADRILIMQMGRIAGEFIPGQVSQEDLLRVASPSP